MKSHRKFFVGILTVVFVLMLAACGNTSDESGAKIEKHAKDDQSTQNKKDDSLKINSTENDSQKDNSLADSIDKGNEEVKKDTTNNVSEKEGTSSTKNIALKEDYLHKLDDAKSKVKEIRDHPIDDTTIALKKVESDVFDIWDGLLNEAYGVLQEQLPSIEMAQLRKEQREWLTHRDHTSKKASLKYEGGTMEQYEYVRVENNLTEARCYELVEKYMK